VLLISGFSYSVVVVLNSNSHNLLLFTSMSADLVDQPCVLVQQKLDILVAFTSGALHWSVWSEFMSLTGLPGYHFLHAHISVHHFSLMWRDSFTRCIDIVLCCSSDFHWVWWLGSHAHLTYLGWPSYAVSLFFVQSDLYIHLYPSTF